MDTKDWTDALGLAQQNPLLYVVGGSIAVAAFGFAWWLRGHWARGTIEALKQRLELARDQLADVRSQLADAQRLAADQQRQTDHLQHDLGAAGWGRQTQPLVESNTALVTALSTVVNSADNLGQTLNVPNLYLDLAPLKPSATRRTE
jgi:hypothetical protein